jgi:hypothetical protein
MILKPSKLATAALALALVPGAALAQDAGASGTAQSSALDFDCARLVAMDTEVVPGVLYFISGFSQGQREMSGSTSDSSSDDAAADSSGADASESSDSGETPETTNPDAAASADSAAANTDIAAISGYFEIPVENLIIACEADPTRMVSDVIDEERERRGGELSDGPEGTAPDRNEGDDADAGSGSADSEPSAADNNSN